MKSRILVNLLFVLLLTASMAGTTLAGMPVEDIWTPDVEVPQPACALLDDPQSRGLMSAMFETRLLIECGREEELGGGAGVPPAFRSVAGPLQVPDVLVNDPTGDEGGFSHTQSETSIGLNMDTGTICATYNDSYHGLVESTGFTGFAQSTDGGASFVDGGVHPAGGGGRSGGDPSVFWRRADGYFYFAALHTNGLGLWRSEDDCATFSFYSLIHSGSGDDKELMAIDNDPSSPYYGRIYVAWTNFSMGGSIYVTYSDNGTTWSTPLNVSGGGNVQGAWPAVAPNGDVYVGWVYWNSYPSGPIDIEIVRSTNGGASFSSVTNPLTGGVNPRDAGATSSCGRPALNGNIRYLPSPQVAVGPDGCVHVVYSYDPDGYNVGDVVNVYYRRSCDSGATWGPEVLLNDDTTLTDQWFPTLSVGPTNVVVAAWYDRRLDASNNYMFDYYKAFSYDGGVTWEPNERVSDVSSPVYIDPNLATCYHGDYDQQIQDEAWVYILWSDDRNVQDGHNDPDVWFEREPVSIGFMLDATPDEQELCTPGTISYTIDVTEILTYPYPVTLELGPVVSGVVGGLDPVVVTPTGQSTLTLTGTLGAPLGDYTLVVTGTAQTTNVHTLEIPYRVNTTPSGPALVAPADGTTVGSLVPTLEWDAVPPAAAYDVQVARDAGFTQVVMTATGVLTTHYQLPGALEPLQQYYWRVRSTNSCGESAYSDAWSFHTPQWPCVLLVDDDGGENAESAYVTALDNLGVHYHVHTVPGSTSNGPDASTLIQYPIVTWLTGEQYGSTLKSADRVALSTYLDGGGGLFLSGWGVGSDLDGTAFLEDYLHAVYVEDGPWGETVGLTGSGFLVSHPVTISIPLAQPATEMTPRAGGQGVYALPAPDGTTGVAYDGSYGVVYFGFGWEWITDAADREGVLQAVLDYLGPCTAEPDAPVAGFDHSAPVELGNPVVFTNTTTGVEPISYTLSFGDGTPAVELSSGWMTTTHLYTQVGTYTVWLTATNAGGPDVYSDTVQIQPEELPQPPMAGFDHSAPVELGSPVVFTNTTTGVEPISYTLSFGDGTPAVELPSGWTTTTHLYTQVGTYTAWLTATNAGGLDVYGDAVQILEPPLEYTIYLPLVLRE